MTLRPCLDCHALSPTSRCKPCERKRDQARGSRQERGYGADHDAARKRWAPLVATGNIKCWRCSEYIKPGDAWDLGHKDHDRSRYAGPECTGCNRATASRVSHT